MNVKAIAIAAAAAAAATSASAADLPVVAEPVDYVQVCDAFGAGYFFIPGTDTCLKISGEAQVDLKSVNLAKDSGETGYQYTSEIDLVFAAKSQTEIGLISTSMKFEYSNNDGTFGDSTVMGDDSYIQLDNDLGSFKIGHTGSIWGFGAETAPIGAVGRDQADPSDAMIASYSRSIGNGVTVSVALDDSERWGAGSTTETVGTDLEIAAAKVDVLDAAAAYDSAAAATVTAYNDAVDALAALEATSVVADNAESVDVIGTIGISQGWGSVSFGAAYHVVNEDESGFAAGASAAFDLASMGVSGGTLKLGFEYADQAVAYIGADGAHKGINAYDWDTNGGKGYNFGAGVKFDVAENVTFGVDGSYLSIEDDRKQEFTRTAVSAGVAWAPVSGFTVSASGGWADTDANAAAKALDNAEELRFQTRIEYAF